MITVLGSGFGLYGHLPALVELGRKVCVPARYRSAFDERAELKQYRSGVYFANDESALLSTSRLLILARRPVDNEFLARQAALIRIPPQLVIEKPPGASPRAALDLEDALTRVGIRHTTPYLFAHCDWARECRMLLAGGRGRDIELNWYFNSDRTTQSWKSTLEQGGGLLNYYFIQLIALADFLLGRHRVNEWRGPQGDSCKVVMAALTRPGRFTASFGVGPSESAFSVTLDGLPVATLHTPFGAVPKRGERDPRIDVLKLFYTSEVFSDADDPAAAERRLRILGSWALLAGA